MKSLTASVAAFFFLIMVTSACPAERKRGDGSGNRRVERNGEKTKDPLLESYKDFVEESERLDRDEQRRRESKDRRSSQPKPGWSYDTTLNHYPDSVRRRGHLQTYAVRQELRDFRVVQLGSVSGKQAELRLNMDPGRKPSQDVFEFVSDEEKWFRIRVSAFQGGGRYEIGWLVLDDSSSKLRVIFFSGDQARPGSSPSLFRPIPTGKGKFSLLHSSGRFVGVTTSGEAQFELVEVIPDSEFYRFEFRITPGSISESRHVHASDFILF